MTKSESHHTSPEDAAIDELLHEFFAAELPAELRSVDERSLEDRPTGEITVPASVQPQRGSYAAYARLAVVVLCLVLTISILYPPPRQAEKRPLELANGNPIDSETGGPNFVHTMDFNDDRALGYFVREQIEPLERLTYDTIDGPVEQRTNISTTNVSVITPETGQMLELFLPELTIEIFPIEDEPAATESTQPESPPNTNETPFQGVKP